MQFRWILLAIAVFAVALYAVSSFWHPSLIDMILVLFVILTWLLSHSERQISERLDRIEVEMKRTSVETHSGMRELLDEGFEEVARSASDKHDVIVERLTELEDHVDGRFRQAEKDVEWRFGNLKIDLENLGKSIEYRIETSSDDPLPNSRKSVASWMI